MRWHCICNFPTQGQCQTDAANTADGAIADSHTKCSGFNHTSLVTAPFAMGLLRSPLARGMPADVPVFFFMGLGKRVSRCGISDGLSLKLA